MQRCSGTGNLFPSVHLKPFSRSPHPHMQILGPHQQLLEAETLGQDEEGGAFSHCISESEAHWGLRKPVQHLEEEAGDSEFTPKSFGCQSQESTISAYSP